MLFSIIASMCRNVFLFSSILCVASFAQDADAVVHNGILGIAAGICVCVVGLLGKRSDCVPEGRRTRRANNGIKSE